MSLETMNEESATGFDKLTDCSISLQTFSEDRFEIVELEIMDEATLIGFVDPFNSHTFYCGPVAGQNSISLDSLTYEMSIESLTSDDT